MNLMRLLLFILGILFFSNVNAQRFERKADSLKYVGDLQFAIEEYAKLLNNKPDDRKIIHKYARVLALNRQNDLAFHYLKEIILKDSSIWVIREPDFYFLLEDERWKEIEDILMNNIEKKYKFNFKAPDLTKELWSMNIRQTAYFYHINLIKRIDCENISVLHALKYAKQKIDSENIHRLEDLIKSSGWPKKSIVKGAAASTAFSIIYNADYSIQKKYFPVIKEAVENGEANLTSLAKLTDKINLKEGKQQIYGTQFIQKEDESWEVKDLFEPEYVNQRRKKVGLGAIDEELFMHAIYWDFKQKEK